MKNSLTKRPKKRESQSPMDAALSFLTARARTRREVERHLDACHYGEVEVMETVDRLEELGLVDDAAFCRDFVASRLRSKPISRLHLKEQLLGHEADRDAVDAALAGLDGAAERSNADEVAKKYARQFERLGPEEKWRRIEARLISRGFDYDTASAAARAAAEAEE